MYLEEMLPDFRKGAKIRSVLWRRGQYLRYDAKTKDIIDEEGITYDITGNLLSSNLWEFYKEPIDWEYIIANSCPCWFWNNDKNLYGASPINNQGYKNSIALSIYNRKKRICFL